MDKKIIIIIIGMVTASLYLGWVLYKSLHVYGGEQVLVGGHFILLLFMITGVLYGLYYIIKERMEKKLKA